jgi:[ribosomal protein S5]-alanine N-acetyltransferase
VVYLETNGSMALVRLIPIDAGMATSLADGAAAFESSYDASVAGDLDHARELVRQNLEWISANPRSAPWGAYLAAAGREVVAVGAFVHAPTARGEVEIAYGTFPRFEGRGLGTATAAALVGVATAQPEVNRVIAHTAPERNASTRILEKLGLVHEGNATDKDIGLCWRWARGI